MLKSMTEVQIEKLYHYKLDREIITFQTLSEVDANVRTTAILSDRDFVDAKVQSIEEVKYIRVE